MKVMMPCSAKLTKLLVANLLILAHMPWGTGTCPMELSSLMIILYHTTELGLDLQEQYV